MRENEQEIAKKHQQRAQKREKMSKRLQNRTKKTCFDRKKRVFLEVFHVIVLDHAILDPKNVKTGYFT